MSRKKNNGEAGPKVPAYIVTFSDMVTLLLTFFVMLLSLANTQDPELIDKGRESFVQSVESLGLGMLTGRKSEPDFMDMKLKSKVPFDEQTDERTLDAREELVRRLFHKINEQMQVLPSQIIAQRTDFTVIDVRFEKGRALLDAQDILALNKFCVELRENPNIEIGGIYVLGLASDIDDDENALILSAKRAQTAAQYLQKNIDPLWSVYWWGAGEGGSWTVQDGPVTEKAQLFVALLR